MKYRTYVFYLFGTIAAIAKGKPEEGDQIVLAQQVLPSSTSTYLRLNDVEKKEQETRENDNPNRFLEVAAMGLFEVVTKVLQDDDCCSVENSIDGDGNDEEYSDVPSQSPNPGPAVVNSPSTVPSTAPSMSASPSGSPSSSPTYTEKELVPSDTDVVFLGYSCSFIDDVILVGAPRTNVDGVDSAGAAYLFNPGEEAEVFKMTVSGAGQFDETGVTVSIDEKIVLGVDSTKYKNFFHVFSREGVFERTVTSNDCTSFGNLVATRGNKIVTNCGKGLWPVSYHLSIYNTQGTELKTFDLLKDTSIGAVAISDEVIVVTGDQTTVYSNQEESDFPLLSEISQGGTSVATLGNKIVIGDELANGAWIYDKNGALLKTLDNQGISSNSAFGRSVAITDEKVVVGASFEDADDGTLRVGSVYIYSAIDGEFVEKIRSPDQQQRAYFGSSVCAYGSYFFVGGYGDNSNAGGAYLFRFSS